MTDDGRPKVASLVRVILEAVAEVGALETAMRRANAAAAGVAERAGSRSTSRPMR